MKIKYFFSASLVLIVALFLTSSVNAQTKRKVVSAKAKPVAKAKAVAKGTLAMETGLIYQSGEVVPVARKEFYLLDNHFGQILKDANINLPLNSGNTKPISDIDEAVEFWGLSSKYGNPDDQTFLTDSVTAMKPHIVSTVTTDFSGKATFLDVPVGTYYLVGTTSTRNSFAVWNLQVEIKAGQNSVVLDQNNAVRAR